MQDQTGTVISILGFYLSLISILGSLFFIHLGTWFKQISTTQQKWKQFKNSTDRGKHIECYLEVYDEKSLQPAFGFILLTIFMVILGVFAEQLKPLLPTHNTLGRYLYWPGYLFFGLYIIVSLVYLIYGRIRVSRLYTEINKKLSS